ncbi:MAG: hypothetical protein ACREEQ_08465, partial [Caulobacteraceae bacterium]
MAQIPDQLGFAPVEGTPTQPGDVRPTDFGLGQDASQLERVAMMQRRADWMNVRVQAGQDRQAAQSSPQFQSFVEADDKRYAGDAAAWDPTKPGFAADQITKTKSAFVDALGLYAASGATPGQVSEFQTLGAQYAAKRGQAANGYEAAKLSQNAQAAQLAAANGFVTQGISAFAPAYQKIVAGYDGASPTLVPQVQAAFDTAWKPVLASAPASMQPRLEAEISQRREEATANALALQGHVQNAYVLRQGADQADGLIDTIVSNPLAYSDVTGQLPTIAATLPADIRDATLKTWQAQAASGRIRGLLVEQKPDQALAELNDGRYDTILDPAQKSQLEDAAEAANRAYGPESITRGAAAATAEARLQADYQARLTTGKGILQPGELDADAKLIGGERVGQWMV